MTVQDLRKKTPDQLVKHIEKIKDDIAQTVREKRTEEQTNIRKVRNLKKEIARALTVINEQQQDNQTVKENA